MKLPHVKPIKPNPLSGSHLTSRPLKIPPSNAHTSDVSGPAAPSSSALQSRGQGGQRRDSFLRSPWTRTERRSLFVEFRVYLDKPPPLFVKFCVCMWRVSAFNFYLFIYFYLYFFSSKHSPLFTYLYIYLIYLIYLSGGLTARPECPFLKQFIFLLFLKSVFLPKINYTQGSVDGGGGGALALTYE